MRSPSRRSLQRLADLAIPWGVGLFMVLAVGEEYDGSSEALRTLGQALALIQGAALRWRRRRPEWVMAVTVVGGLGTQILAPEVIVPFAGLFAVGALAAARPPRVSLIGLVALEAVVATTVLTATVGDSLFTAALAVGAWGLGEAARNRRLAIHEEARRAVSEEQARIARELHDVIAHSVSVIVVQAAAARDVFDERPDQARAALLSIEQAGRGSLRELRRLLGVVRPGPETGPPQPQPGLALVEQLAEPLRAGGLEVVVRCEGAAPELSAGVDVSAYRIVQEALTNVLRHARATRAKVVVSYGPDLVEVVVQDDGGAPTESNGDSGGHGLAGMRERAALVGGTLEAGPLPESGYRVRARLPLEAQARSLEDTFFELTAGGS